MKKSTQMSESLIIGILLTLSGGFMDAYSYLARGKVFANAQTGNMLLLGVNLSQGNITHAIRYLFPILAFALGIALAAAFRIRGNGRLHWRQPGVFLEAIVLVLVAFLPQSMNLLANSLTSLACGIQVESFRKIHGNGFASTMCIGNLRNGTQNLVAYLDSCIACHHQQPSEALLQKNKQHLKNGLLYYSIIFFFVLGAVAGSFFIAHFAERAILVCSALLLSAFGLMFIDPEY